METLKIGDRIFEQCEDVPLAVKEKRKLFWINNGTPFELRCVSENMGPQRAALFLYDQGGIMGESYIYNYPKTSKYNYLLYFDVTPEKRYAIWNKVLQRFTYTSTDGTNASHSFTTREAAETWLMDHQHRRGYAIVEFDIPNQE